MTPDLGQGAGQAIEDAAALILLLRKAHTESAFNDLDAILARYNHLRRPHTRALWRQSRLTRRVAHSASPLDTALRDAALRVTPAGLMTHAMSNVQRWRTP